jgi:hypothetical protein
MKWCRALVFVCFSFVLGCSDRTPEDVERDQASRELRSFQSAEGIYEGQLISFQNRDILGEMSLSLRVVTQAKPSTQGVSSVQQLSLAGQFWLKSKEDLFSFDFQSGFFNPKSGEVDIDLRIARPTGRETLFKIQGFLAAGQFEGSLEAVSFPERGASFVLTQKNENPRVRPMMLFEKLPAPNLEIGRWHAMHEGKRVDLFLYEPFQDGIEKFVRLFVPQFFMNAVVDFSGDVQIVFNQAKLDTRTGVLKASYQNSTNYRDILIYLTCSTRPGGRLDSDWQCLFENLANGISFDLDFQKLKNEL